MHTVDLVNTVRLLISCPDQPGIIAKVASFLSDFGANITDLDQHSSDVNEGMFFMRLEFQIQEISDNFTESFEKKVAQPFQMEWTLQKASEHKRMALLVSKFDHAFLEIIWRTMRNELPLQIPFIVSNHEDLAKSAAHFNIPFHYIPVNANTKQAAEDKLLSLCEGKVDGLILARYMQILSEKVVKQYPHQIINIHHSFLPAFIGANPYQQAFDKGVKLIGATAHYVTPELDMGPIIAQDVVRVSHRLSAAQLKELGQDVERTVLARAVKAHLENRIIVQGNKTIVFEGIN